MRGARQARETTGIRRSPKRCHQIAKQLCKDSGYDWFLFENVDGYPLEDAMKDIKGYYVQVVEVSPIDFGYKCGRKRKYALGLNTSTTTWDSDKSLSEIVRLFHRTPATTPCDDFYTMTDEDTQNNS